jgi:GcrA cell cycle regulator
MPTKVWLPAVKERLRELWGIMNAEQIGIELFGVAGKKNAVVGEAHRMGLPKIINSPSTPRKPVKTDARARAQREYERRKREFKKAGEPWRTRDRLAIAAALPALEALRAIAEQPFKHEVEPMPKRPVNPAPPPLRRQPLAPATPRVVEKEPAIWANQSCCWPFGDPGTPGFKFCCDPAEFGKSYCLKHRKIAYQPKQRERVW